MRLTRLRGCSRSVNCGCTPATMAAVAALRFASPKPSSEAAMAVASWYGAAAVTSVCNSSVLACSASSWLRSCASSASFSCRVASRLAFCAAIPFNWSSRDTFSSWAADSACSFSWRLDSAAARRAAVSCSFASVSLLRATTAARAAARAAALAARWSSGFSGAGASAGAASSVATQPQLPRLPRVRLPPGGPFGGRSPRRRSAPAGHRSQLRGPATCFRSGSCPTSCRQVEPART